MEKMALWHILNLQIVCTPEIHKETAVTQHCDMVTLMRAMMAELNTGGNRA
jgi:hypothetical protein